MEVPLAAAVPRSWQHGSRDFVSSASQDFHSRLSREATANRRSSRTGIRLATSAETQTVTTKVITNNNHCHALTVQVPGKSCVTTLFLPE